MTNNLHLFFLLIGVSCFFSFPILEYCISSNPMPKMNTTNTNITVIIVIFFYSSKILPLHTFLSTHHRYFFTGGINLTTFIVSAARLTTTNTQIQHAIKEPTNGNNHVNTGNSKILYISSNK